MAIKLLLLFRASAPSELDVESSVFLQLIYTLKHFTSFIINLVTYHKRKPATPFFGTLAKSPNHSEKKRYSYERYEYVDIFYSRIFRFTLALIPVLCFYVKIN